MKPLVSIITPIYNSAKYLTETILSIQNQSFTDWELLLVDDCSTDDSLAIAKSFTTDLRIKIIALPTNSGAGVARNTALEAAIGRYIAFVDSDDLWLPKKLEKQLDFMCGNNQPFTFCFYDCIDANSNPIGIRIEAPKVLSYRQLFFCNFVGNLSGIYDSHFFGKIPISSIRKRQDWILWLTILKRIKVAKPVPESLALYRVHGESMSASKTKLLRHNFMVYRLFHQLNVVSAFMAMLGFLAMQFLVKPTYKRKITAQDSGIA